MTNGFDFIGSWLGACSALPVAPLLTSLDGLVGLFSFLSKAHLGYSHTVFAL